MTDMIEFIVFFLTILAVAIGLSAVYVSWQNKKQFQQWALEQEAAYESKMRFSEEVAELELDVARAVSAAELNKEYLETMKAMEIMAELEGDQKNDHR